MTEAGSWLEYRLALDLWKFVFKVLAEGLFLYMLIFTFDLDFGGEANLVLLWVLVGDSLLLFSGDVLFVGETRFTGVTERFLERLYTLPEVAVVVGGLVLVLGALFSTSEVGVPLLAPDISSNALDEAVLLFAMIFNRCWRFFFNNSCAPRMAELLV